MKFFALILAVLTSQLAPGQTIEDYFQDKNYSEVVRFEQDTGTLTGKQLDMLGYAFFKTDDNARALLMFDKAIARGYTGASVHFHRALTLESMEKPDEAIGELQEGLRLEPDNQEFMSMLGLIYYFKEDYDTALKIYQEARQLPNTFQAPYYMTAHIYHLRGDYDTALSEFYRGLDSLAQNENFYVMALMDIGLLEYSHTRNFKKSAEAYEKAAAMQPGDYEIYPKLMKACNASGQFERADTIFQAMVTAFEKGELPEEYQKYPSMSVDEMEWQGQKIVTFRYLKKPTGLLDYYYEAFMLDQAGKGVERRFMTEKTLDLGTPRSPKHLFCEAGEEGRHYTYPYGWKEDNIPLADFRKAILRVLEGKMKPTASSVPKKKD